MYSIIISLKLTYEHLKDQYVPTLFFQVPRQLSHPGDAAGKERNWTDSPSLAIPPPKIFWSATVQALPK